MAPRPVPASIVAVVCVALIGTAGVMAAAAVALSADGPFSLVRLITTEEIFAPNARYLGSLVRQAPTLVGIRSGLTDTYWLAVLLGVGSLVVPAAAWSLAVLLSAYDSVVFSAVAVTAAITALSTWFCSVSESVLALALTGLVSVLLARPQPWRWGAVVLACASSIILVASYETAIATSAILCAWALARGRHAATNLERSACLGVALASSAAIGMGISGLFSTQNTSNSRSFAYFLVSLEPGWVYVLIACGAALVAAAVVTRQLVRNTLWVLALSGTLLATVSFEPSPSSAYAARGAAALAVLALQAFLAGCWYARSRRRQTDTNSSAWSAWNLALPAIYVVALCATNLAALRAWSSDLEAFRAQVTGARGLVQVDDVLPPDRRRAVWGWTAPSLSLVVRASPADAILVDSNPSYVPFPPSSARSQIPDTYRWSR